MNLQLRSLVNMWVHASLGGYAPLNEGGVCPVPLFFRFSCMSRIFKKLLLHNRTSLLVCTVLLSTGLVHFTRFKYCHHGRPWFQSIRHLFPPQLSLNFCVSQCRFVAATFFCLTEGHSGCIIIVRLNVLVAVSAYECSYFAVSIVLCLSQSHAQFLHSFELFHGSFLVGSKKLTPLKVSRQTVPFCFLVLKVIFESFLNVFFFCFCALGSASSWGRPWDSSASFWRNWFPWTQRWTRPRQGHDARWI